MTTDEFYKAITHDVPCLTFGLLAIGRSDRSVWRFLDGERRAGLIEYRRHLVPAVTNTDPLAVQLPGREPPDFDALCYVAEHRAAQDIGEEVLLTATEKARKRFAGCFGTPVRLSDVQHHARLAAVYWLELTPEDRALWVPEARLGVAWDDPQHVPDALVGDQIVEVIGHSYGADKCRRRAAAPAWSRRVVRWY